ncbi:2-isopropylmalate synthase [Chlamydia trachomatis]|nr:2-isopropylmalate synthase [Chlamydia trachomatis]
MVGVKSNSLPLGKLSGRHAFIEKLKDLQLEFDEAEIKTLFAKFKDLADKKQDITDSDIRALVAGTTVENVEGFHFGDLKLASHTDERITATVTMVNQEAESVNLVADGKGSVEAIFNAIDQFFHQTVRLDSFSIDAITDGIDAQAAVNITVENEDTDTIFNATGIDFDVLKAAALPILTQISRYKRKIVSQLHLYLKKIFQEMRTRND